MGRIGEVLTVETLADGGLDIRVDPGGGAAQSAEYYADPGDDSQPLPGDTAALDASAGAGVMRVTGFHDPSTSREAGPGDKRVYSRSEPGVAAAEVWLKANGDIVIRSIAPGRSITIEAAGEVRVDAPSVVLGDGSAPVARVGDLAVGTVIMAAPGTAVPVSVQVVGPGSTKVKA